MSTGPRPVKPAFPKLPSVNPLRKEFGEAKVPSLKREQEIDLPNQRIWEWKALKVPGYKVQALIKGVDVRD